MHPSLVESTKEPELSNSVDNPNPDGVSFKVEFDENDEKRRDEAGDQGEPQVLAEEVSTPIRLAAVCSEIQAIVVATITDHNDANPQLGPLWGQQARLLTRLAKEQGQMELSYGGYSDFNTENVEDEEARLQGLREEKEELQRQNALLKKRGLEVAAALTREVKLAEDERRAGRQAVERELHSMEREKFKNHNDRDRLQKDCAVLEIELERYKKKSLDMERVRAEDMQRQEETLATLKQEFERKLEERSRKQKQFLPVKYATTRYSPAKTLGSRGFLSAIIRQPLAIDLEQEKEERWQQSWRTGTMLRVFLGWLRVTLNSRSERIKNWASSIVQAEEALARKESALSSLALSLDTLDESLRQREVEVETCKAELTEASRQQLSHGRKADEILLLEREKLKEMEESVKEERQRAEDAQLESIRALKEAEELRFELEGIKENRNTEDSRKLDIMRSSLACEIDVLRRNMEAEKCSLLDRETLLEAAKREVEAREVQLEEERMNLDLRSKDVEAYDKRLRQSTDTLDQRESVIQEMRHQAYQMSESLAIQQQRAAELDKRLTERELAISDKEILLDSRHVKLNEVERKLIAQKTALDSREKNVARTSNELSSQIEHVEHVEHQAKLAKEELEMALATSRRDLEVKQTRLEQAENHLTELKRRITEEKVRCDALSASSEEASAREISVREEVHRVEEELEQSRTRIHELTMDCVANSQRLKDTQKRLEVEREEVKRVSSNILEEREVFEMERAQALELRSKLMSRLKESEQALLSATENPRAEALRLESSLEDSRKEYLSLERMCKVQEVQIESISVELDAARKDGARDILAARTIADDLKSQLKQSRSQLDEVNRLMGERSKTHSNQLSTLQEQLAEAKYFIEVVNLQMRDLTTEHVEQLKLAEHDTVELKREMSVLSVDLNKLRKDVSRSETDKRKLLTSSEEAKRELTRVTEELSRLKMQEEESAKRRTENEMVFASELANLKQYQSKSIDLHKQNQKLEEIVSTLSRQVEESTRQRAEAKSEFDSQLHHFEKYHQVSIQLQAQNQQLEDQVLSLMSERDRKASELAVLVETKEREMGEIKELMKLWSKGKDEDLHKVKAQFEAADATARDKLAAANLRISELKSCETDTIRLRDEVERLRDREKIITVKHEDDMEELLLRCGAVEDRAESTSLEVQHLLNVNAEALREKEMADTARAELKQENEAMQYKLSLAGERLTASKVSCLELEGRLKGSVDALEDNEQQLHLLEAAAEASCEHVDDLKKQLASCIKDFEQCRMLLETGQNELQESTASRVELVRKLKSKEEVAANRESRLQLRLKERTSRLKDCETSLKDKSDNTEEYKLRLDKSEAKRDKLHQMLEKLTNESKNQEKSLLSELKEAQKMIQEKDQAFTAASQRLENVSKEITQDRETHLMELNCHVEIENKLQAEVQAVTATLRKNKEYHLAELERVAKEDELRLQDQWDSVRAQTAENKLHKQRLSDQAASLESVRVALETAESVTAEEAESISVRGTLVREAEERLKQRIKEEEVRLNDIKENIRKREEVIIGKEMAIKVESERLAEEMDSLVCKEANLSKRQENVEEESLCLEESLKTLEERFEQESNTTEVTKKILQATREGLERKEVELAAQEKDIESEREEMERKLNMITNKLDARQLQHEAWKQETVLKMDEVEATLNADKEDLEKRGLQMDSREREFSVAKETMQVAVEELEKRRQQLEERENSCNIIQDELIKVRLSLEVMQRKKEEENDVANSELQLARETLNAELSQQAEERAMMDEMHQQAVKRKEDIEEEFLKLVQEREELAKLREVEIQRNLELQEDNKKIQLDLQREQSEIEYEQAVLLRDTDALEKEKAALYLARQQVAARVESVQHTTDREKQLNLWAVELAKQGDALKAQATRLAQAHQSLRVRELKSAKDLTTSTTTEISPPSTSILILEEENMQMLEADRLSLASERAALKVKKNELQQERIEFEGLKEGSKVMMPHMSGGRRLSLPSDIDCLDWTSDFPNASREVLEFSYSSPQPSQQTQMAENDNSKERLLYRDEKKIKAQVEDAYHSSIATAAAASGGGVLSVLFETDPTLTLLAINVIDTLAEARKAWQPSTTDFITRFGSVEQQEQQLLRSQETTKDNDTSHYRTSVGSDHYYHEEKYQQNGNNNISLSIEETNHMRGLMIELEAEKQLLGAERERLLTDRANLNRRMEALEVKETKYWTEAEAEAVVQLPNTVVMDAAGIRGEGGGTHDYDYAEEEKESAVETTAQSQLLDDAVVVGDNMGVITGDNTYGGDKVIGDNEENKQLVVVEEDHSGTEMPDRSMKETGMYDGEKNSTILYPSIPKISCEGKHNNNGVVELNKVKQTTYNVVDKTAFAPALAVVDSVAALNLGKIPPSVDIPDSGSHPTSPLLERENDNVISINKGHLKVEDVAEECRRSWQQQRLPEISEQAQDLVGSTTSSSTTIPSVSAVVGYTKTDEEKCYSLLPQHNQSENTNQHDDDIELCHQEPPLDVDENESHHHQIPYNGLTTDDATLEDVKLRLAGSSHELQKGLGRREALLSGFGMSSDGLLCLSDSEEYSVRSLSWTSSGGECVEKKVKEGHVEYVQHTVEMQKPLLHTAVVAEENVDDDSPPPESVNSSCHQSFSFDPNLNEEEGEVEYEIDEDRNLLRDLMMSVHGLETPSEKTISNVDEEEEKNSSCSENLSLTDLDEGGQSEGWQQGPLSHPNEPVTTAIHEQRSDLRSQLRELAHLVSEASDTSDNNETTT